MSEEKNISAKVLGQISLMQSVVIQLPDKENMLKFVCRGMKDIPSVHEVDYLLFDNSPNAETRSKKQGYNEKTFYIKESNHKYAALFFQISEEAEFQPYIPYIENFCSMLAVIFKERQQRKENESLMADLELRVAQRTKKLESEIKNRQHAEEELKAVNQQLEANNQQLMAAEQQLRAANQQFEAINQQLRNVLENTRNAHYSHTTEHIITYFSPQVEEILGYHPEEVKIKWTALASDNPINEIGFKKTVKAIETGERQDPYELELVRKDGVPVIVEVNESPLVKDGKTVAIIGSLADITERKQAEIKLKESENKYRTIFNSTGTVTMLVRNNTYIEMANHEVERVTGFPADELAGSKWTDHVAPHSLEMMMHYHKTRRTNPEKVPSQYEVDLIHKSGELRRSLLTIGMIPSSDLSIVTLIDITERYKATQKLKESEEKLNEAQEIASLGNLVWNLQTNETFWSSMLSQIHGLDQKDSIPSFDEFLEHVHEDDRKLIKESVTKALETGKYLCEYRIKRFDTGEIRYLYTVGRIEYDGKHQPLLLKATEQDITERKKAEQKILEQNEEYEALNEDLRQTNDELQMAKEKAEESDRLKSAFLTNMSHEIRTPMNGILGFTDLLKEPQLSGDQKERYIKVIERSGKRMLDTINDIIDISKIESGQVKVENTVVSVNKILNEQYNFFQREAHLKGLQLLYTPTLSDEDSKILTDRNKLEGVLINLIKNAIKYTKKGEIEIGYAKKDNKGKDFLQFYVKDTGIGIPSNRIESVFNRFEQADIEDKNAFEGSGLGLAISKSYVEMLGGKISAKSEEGSGSTFLFEIPYIKQSQKVKDEKESDKKRQNNSFSNTSVIIAEDDEDSKLFLKTILRDNFKKTIFTTSGTGTIEAMKKHPETDLILMDIKMPGMNGYEATRQIRKFNQEVIIIAQTAYGLSGDAEKAIQAGCDDYIAKPINKNALLEKIRMRLVKKEKSM